MKQRIKAVTDSIGKTRYHIQTRILFFWIQDPVGYFFELEEAKKYIDYNPSVKKEYYY